MKRKRLVMVNMKTGRAFRGIVWSWGILSETMVLKKAEVIRAGGEVVNMDGELILFKRDVDFVQVLR